MNNATVCACRVIWQITIPVQLCCQSRLLTFQPLTWLLPGHRPSTHRSSLVRPISLAHSTCAFTERIRILCSPLKPLLYLEVSTHLLVDRWRFDECVVLKEHTDWL